MHQMVKRFHPPVVNDEAERPDYVEMHEHTYGGFVEYDDYAMLQENQVQLRQNARRMMTAVKNSCVDIVTARLVEASDPNVVNALKALEKELMEMEVDFALFKPRTEH